MKPLYQPNDLANVAIKFRLGDISRDALFQNCMLALDGMPASAVLRYVPPTERLAFEDLLRHFRGETNLAGYVPRAHRSRVGASIAAWQASERRADFSDRDLGQLDVDGLEELARSFAPTARDATDPEVRHEAGELLERVTQALAERLADLCDAEGLTRPAD